MKQRSEGLKVVHSVETSMRRAGIEPTEANLRYWRGIPDKAHNLVWTHKSGRTTLVIGCHASHIADMDVAEGRKLLDELLAWPTQPRFIYRHEWSVADMPLWDNAGVLPSPTQYPDENGRPVHRH